MHFCTLTKYASKMQSFVYQILNLGKYAAMFLLEATPGPIMPL